MTTLETNRVTFKISLYRWLIITLLSLLRYYYRVTIKYGFTPAGIKNETVPEGGKVVSEELDISRDSEVNMSRDLSFSNSFRGPGTDSSPLRFVNGNFRVYFVGVQRWM